jgi:hypothetical protein
LKKINSSPHSIFIHQVMLIAQSMDTVEREFEVRDKHIANLEAMLVKAESDLATANDVIRGQRSEIVQAMSTQKTLLMQYHESEIESRELHEFLQAEKYTLAGKFKFSSFSFFFRYYFKFQTLVLI